MKKTIVALMFVLTLSPVLASAQVVDASITRDAVIASLRAQIRELTIELLKLQIGELVKQINYMVAHGLTETTELPSSIQVDAEPQVSQPSVSFGVMCSSGEAEVEVDIANLSDYNRFETRFTGQSDSGQNINQGNSFQRSVGSPIVYGLPQGTYNYSLKALKGATAMGTENTQYDTREIVWSTSGSLSVRDCQ